MLGDIKHEVRLATKLCKNPNISVTFLVRQLHQGPECFPHYLNLGVKWR
jgi:hypothetical protein